MSAPVQASSTLGVSVTEPPVSTAIMRAFSTSDGMGICSAGPQATKCMPIFAQVTIREFATLFCASPMNTSLSPSKPPGKFSWMVSRSAIIWVGCDSVVRPFHTGTLEYSASSSTSSWP